MGGNIDPRCMQFIADRSTWKEPIKKIKGKRLILVATRTPRNPRKYRTVNIFNIEGTGLIVFNRSRNGVFFMKIAVKNANMQRFYSTFVVPPTTKEEKQWLDLNDYKLVV